MFDGSVNGGEVTSIVSEDSNHDYHITTTTTTSTPTKYIKNYSRSSNYRRSVETDTCEL